MEKGDTASFPQSSTHRDRRGLARHLAISTPFCPSESNDALAAVPSSLSPILRRPMFNCLPSQSLRLSSLALAWASGEEAPTLQVESTGPSRISSLRFAFWPIFQR